MGYASDTASIIVGERNSVLSQIHEKPPKLFSLGFTSKIFQKRLVSQGLTNFGHKLFEIVI